MNKLKIAVIGTGLVGSFHAETFYRNPNSELVSVCDIDKDKSNSIANKFNCKAYDNFEQLIATEPQETEEEGDLSLDQIKEEEISSEENTENNSDS